MSETTNTAEIRIVADASGVEAGLRQATTAAERAERTITSGANNSARSQGSLISAIQRTTAQMESGGRAGSRYFEILAQQRGVNPQALEPYLRQLRAVEQAQQRAGTSAAQTTNAMRQLPAQLTDTIVGLQGGQNMLTILLQQGGQVRDSFGSIGGALRAVGGQILGLLNPVTLATAAVGGLTYAYYAGSKEARAYNLAIATTGNAAGTSAALMAEAATQTASFIGSQSNAATVLTSMVATGQISSAAMVDLSVAAITAQRDLGREVATTVEEFASLGKDPVKVLADLVGKYHHVTAATYAQVKALQDEGRTVEAVTLAQKAHADGINSQSGRVVENLGYIESAWRGVKEQVVEAAGGVKDWFLSTGRDDTMADLTASAAAIQKNIDLANDRKDTWGARKQQALLDVVNGQIAAMQKKLGLSQQQAEAEARSARAEQLRVEIANGMDKLLSREELRTRALAAARTKAAENGLSKDETRNLLAITEKEYADVEEAARKKREAAAKAAAEALKKEAGLLAELAGLTPGFAEDWDRLSKAYAKGALSLDQLTKAQADLLAKQPGIKKASDDQLKAQAESDKLYEQGIKTAEQYRDSLLEQLTAQRDSNQQIGLTGPALGDVVALRLESAAALKEETAAALEADEKGSRVAQIYRDQAAALRDLAGEKRAGAAIQTASDTSKKELQDLERFLDPAKAQTFGEALREAFGVAGDSLSRLLGGLDGFGKRQAEIAKNREAAEKNRGKDGFDEIKYLKSITELNERDVKNRLQGYGDMASAAKGFFSDNSKGYKLMEGAERTFRAFELASQMESLYTHLFVTTTKATATTTGQAVETGAVVAGEAARNVAKVPGVFMSFMSALGPWGAAAAAVAIAAVLGGAFSGGGSVSVSESRQKSQGTGTVLGSDAKSESIDKSLEMIENATFQGLSISTDMLSQLRSIDSNLTNFSTLVVQTTGIKGTLAAGIESGSGGFWGKLGNSIFGGKTSVEDTGFSMKPIAFADVFRGWVDSYEYADTKKSGGWFSSDKYRTQIEGLGQEGNRQIALVLTSLYGAVESAGGMLGLAGKDFTDKLNSFVVDIGMVSLKGLSGEEIEKEIQAVFSKVGDQLALYSLDGLKDFQKSGEGYLETLTRIATGYQTVTVVAESLGMPFDAIGVGSIAARQRLIDLAGGLEEFKESADSFMSDFYTDKERADALRARIQPTLEKFGIQTGADDSMQQFRDVVKSLRLETAAGAQDFATLMQIMPAFKQIADIDKALFEDQVELARSRRDLEIQIMELTGDKVGALAATRALESEETDSSLRALLQRVYSLQDETAALELAGSKRQLEAQILGLLGDKAGQLAITRELELAGIDAVLRPQKQRIYDLEDEATALQAANAKRSLEAQILGLLGDKAGELAIQRELELAGMDPALRALRQRYFALQDEAAAAETANSLLTLQAQIYELTGDKAGAAAVLAQQHAIALQALDPALRNATLQLWGLQAAAKEADQVKAIAAALVSGVESAFTALQSVVGREKDLLQEVANKHKALADALRGTLDSMSVSGQEREDRSAAQAQIAAALAIAKTSGTLPDVDSLKGALSIVSRDSSSLFSTQEDYLRDFYSTQADIADLAGLTDKTLSVEEQSIKRLDDILASAQQQLNALKGLDTTMLTLVDVMRDFDRSIGAAQADPVASSGGSLTKLYRELLGRAPDATGLEFYKNRMAEGVTLDAIRKAIMESVEYKQLRGFAVGTNYVPTNMPAMIHEGERIIPAADNRELIRRLANPSGESQELAREVIRLGAKADELFKVLYQVAKNTARGTDTLERLDRMGFKTRKETSV